MIEIMIVMFLMATFMGVLAYNYKGSLEQGKAYKTKAAMDKLTSILSLRQAEDPSLDFTSNWKEVVRTSPLVHSADSLIVDGWGRPYEVSINDNGEVCVRSEMYEKYTGKK